MRDPRQVVMSDTPPDCPKCGAQMVLRTAKKGKNTGSQFLGCSSFPGCRGTRTLEGDVADQNAPETASSVGRQPKVEWVDAAIHRQGWTSRYTTAGGRFRCMKVDADPARLANCWIGVSDLPAFMPMDSASRRVVGVLRKIVQRGLTPPLDPRVEASYLTTVGYEGVDPFDSLVPKQALVGPLDEALDLDAVARIWLEVGWLSGVEKKPAPKTFLAAANTEVGLLDDEAECTAQWAPGTIRYQATDLALCAVTAR